MPTRYGIGIDFGGTYIKFAAVSKQGELLHSTQIPTEPNAEEALRAMTDGILSLLYEISLRFPTYLCAGIGIGVPGPVSSNGESSIHSDKISGWEKLPLSNIMRERIPERLFNGVATKELPIIAENDANVAALGESTFGAGKRFDHFVMITLGTGVGGGIIWQNKIFRGANGAAGELGHITIDYSSPVVYAGIRGTLEGKIGQKQITEYAKSLLSCYPDSIITTLCQGNLDRLEPKLLSHAAKEQDALALATFQYVGQMLGIGLGTILSVLDIRKFVIGGGVSGAGDFIFSPAREMILKHSLKEMHDGIEIVPAELGNQAGVMGAAALTF